MLLPALTRYNTVIALLTLGDDRQLADAVRDLTPKVMKVAELAGDKGRNFKQVEDDLQNAIGDFRDAVDDIQQFPASVAANGQWTESPAFLGSAKAPVHSGDTLQIEAVVVRSGASYHGTPLGILARQLRPIPDPGAITGLISQSPIVILSADRQGARRQRAH